MSDLDIILAKLTELDTKISNIPGAAVINPPEIIKAEELCRRLDISEPTLIIWRKNNKIPFIKVDGTFRYNWPKVIEQLESNKQKK